MTLCIRNPETCTDDRPMYNILYSKGPKYGQRSTYTRLQSNSGSRGCVISDMLGEFLTFMPPVDEPDDEGLHSEDGGKMVKVSTLTEKVHTYRVYSFT